MQSTCIQRNKIALKTVINLYNERCLFFYINKREKWVQKLQCFIIINILFI